MKSQHTRTEPLPSFKALVLAEDTVYIEYFTEKLVTSKTTNFYLSITTLTCLRKLQLLRTPEAFVPATVSFASRSREAF